eukprot:GILK01002165.1.p1 GENE.GILK01002165.1~~GILK01002165.1.p1  ORF type:complete len:1017 (+),score=168.44 GILK01002165.1:92-3142(+)
MADSDDEHEHMMRTVPFALHDAAQRGDQLKLSELLEIGNNIEGIDEGDKEGKTPLHAALLFANPDCVNILIAKGADVTIPFDGFGPLHLAMALAGFEAYRSRAVACTRIVMANPDSDIDQRDRAGYTALHRAASLGLVEIVAELLALGADAQARDTNGSLPVHVAVEHRQASCLDSMLQEVGSELLTVTNGFGDTPLHIAVIRGAWDCVRVLLRTGTQALLTVENIRGEVPMAVAKRCGFDAQLLSIMQNSTDSLVNQDFRKGQTLLVYHDACLDHTPLPGDPLQRHKKKQEIPENPDRLQVLIGNPTGLFLQDEFVDSLLWLSEYDSCPLGDIVKVHDYNYIKMLQQKCAKLESAANQTLINLDGDTCLSKGSWTAALKAAGAVIAAVDQVVGGNCRNAFCAVRPPGHHAGPHGIVRSKNDPDGSHGFCLLNNIAIGAAYARSHYRYQNIKRIAIVDFDVHHGNGTEAIVRNLKPNKLTHAITSPFCNGAVSSWSYKPWLSEDDEDHVFFTSIHGYGKRSENISFYPGSGSANERDIHNDHESTKTHIDANANAKVVNVPLAVNSKSPDFRELVVSRVLPALVEFKPDIIFISAGFDGHAKDPLNFGLVNLYEDDYRWVTEEIVKVANSCCDGRIVSVLEGGYRTRGGILSPFAQSVGAHVRALMNATKDKYTTPSANTGVPLPGITNALRASLAAEFSQESIHDEFTPVVMKRQTIVKGSLTGKAAGEGEGADVTVENETVKMETFSTRSSRRRTPEAREGGGQEEEDGPRKRRRTATVNYAAMVATLKTSTDAAAPADNNNNISNNIPLSSNGLSVSNGGESQPVQIDTATISITHTGGGGGEGISTEEGLQQPHDPVAAKMQAVFHQQDNTLLETGLTDPLSTSNMVPSYIDTEETERYEPEILEVDTPKRQHSDSFSHMRLTALDIDKVLEPLEPSPVNELVQEMEEEEIPRGEQQEEEAEAEAEDTPEAEAEISADTTSLLTVAYFSIAAKRSGMNVTSASSPATKAICP